MILPLPLHKKCWLGLALAILIGITFGVLITLWFFNPLISVVVSPLTKSSAFTVEGNVATASAQSITIVRGAKSLAFKVAPSTSVLRFSGDYGGQLRQSSISAALVNHAYPKKINASQIKPGEQVSILLRAKGIATEIINIYVTPVTKNGQ